MNGLIARALEPSEWPLFRDLRLEALKTDGWAYASTHAEEAAHTPEEWRATVSGPDHQIFGLFDGDRLVGMSAAFTWREDPSGETAVFAMSYLRPEYRGRGLSETLNDMRLNWAVASGRFKRIVGSIRGSNAISAKVLDRMKFARGSRATRIWPDGASDDEIFYQFDIQPGGVA